MWTDGVGVCETVPRCRGPELSTRRFKGELCPETGVGDQSQLLGGSFVQRHHCRLLATGNKKQFAVCAWGWADPPRSCAKRVERRGVVGVLSLQELLLRLGGGFSP